MAGRHAPLFHVTYDGPEAFGVANGRTFHQGIAVEVGKADARAAGKATGDWTIEEVGAHLIATGPQNQPTKRAGRKALHDRLGRDWDED